MPLGMNMTGLEAGNQPRIACACLALRLDAILLLRGPWPV